MSEIKTVRVNLAERSYDIRIGTALLAKAGEFLVERVRATHIALITDENVHKPHAMRVAESFGEQNIDVDVFVVEAGETSKSLDVAASLWQALLDVGADRKTVVAAVGGGVVGDLAGFIAATYARGVKFLQVPTSLLAQVDSSVGGKVGIDLPNAKNMVGAFLQPLGVLIDTDTLATLPTKEYCAGLAEVVKYGVILDGEFFRYLEENVPALQCQDATVLGTVIAKCCRLKADIVENDEREETGLRAVLNFGHTFGHAFEAMAGFGNLLHGEAVAIGMVCAARLAERLKRLSERDTIRIRSLLQALKLPTEVPPCDPQQILNLMRHDKKIEHGRLRFVLPNRIGEVELISDVPENEVLAVLKE